MLVVNNTNALVAGFKAVQQSVLRYTGMSAYNLRFRGDDYYINWTPELGTVDLPLTKIGYNFERKFTYIQANVMRQCEVSDNIKEALSSYINGLKDNDVSIMTMYVDWYESTCRMSEIEDVAFIDKDLWTEYTDDSIKSLFNKCNEQVKLRDEERTGNDINDISCRIYKSKIKNCILYVTDYPDLTQESNFYLAFGLIPVIFTDIKSKLNEQELEFFRCLVSRSQVKRINNSRATSLYNELVTSDEYMDFIKQNKLINLFKNMSNYRFEYLKNENVNILNEADSCLNNYNNLLNRYNDNAVLMNNYLDNSDSLVEQLKLSKDVEGVEEISEHNSSTLCYTFKTNVEFFDCDEAELQLNRRPESFWTKFLYDIFVLQKAKLTIISKAYFSLRESFRPMTTVPTASCLRLNSLFNPHFQYYACMGDYRPTMLKAMKDGDPVMFASIGVVATKSINFADGAVISRWIEDMNNLHSNYPDADLFNIKCLNNENGTYTIKEWYEGALGGEDNEETND